MIWESAPWKDQLAKDAILIDRWAKRTKNSARRGHLLEKKIFITAYALRRLIEADKISSSFGERAFTCMSFPRLSDKMTVTNNHRIDKLYSFENGERRTLLLPDLLNMIIHSLAFSFSIEDAGEVSGFLIASDRKQKCLWLVSLADFCRVMSDASADYPTNVVRVYDDETDNWFTWTGHGEPPAHIQAKFDALRCTHVKP